MIKLISPLLLILFLGSCVGTDLVDEQIVPEKLSITSNFNNAKIGDKIKLQANFFDSYGYKSDCDVTWETKNEGVVKISADGFAEILDTTRTEVIAKCSGSSDTIIVHLGGTPPDTTMMEPTVLRMGTFQNGAGGYFARGTGDIIDDNGVLKVRLNEDFATSSGPSVYLFLATHKDGGYAYEKGGQVITSQSVQLTPNKMTKYTGVQQFEIPAGVDANDYDFIVVYCILGPVFGSAQLN